MVRPLFGLGLELSRCGVTWNMRGLARTTRVRHALPDFAAPAAKVFRIGGERRDDLQWEHLIVPLVLLAGTSGERGRISGLPS
jgi:hypothetical protein